MGAEERPENRNVCRACQQRPVKDATVCTGCADDLARALADVTALVTRPCQHQYPEKPTADDPTRCILCHRKALDRETNGSLPSSPFDTPSSLALLAGTRNLGDDLDVAGSHQATLTRRERSNVVPTSRVFMPNTRIGRAHAALDAALTMWANVVQADHDGPLPGPARPRRDPSGRGLGDLAGWLLHHVEWIRHHPAGHEAVAQITSAVAAVERAVDAPPNRLFLGPCWQPDETAPTGECTADLYALAPPAGAEASGTVQCPRCLHVHDIAVRRRWLREHMDDTLATATEASRAAGIIGLPVSAERIWQWKSRGRITQHGTRQVGQKAHPLYRVGDILDLAANDPEKRGRRSA